jgi:hypothetical protein
LGHVLVFCQNVPIDNFLNPIKISKKSNATGGDQNIGTFLKLAMARAFSLRGDLFLVSKTRKGIGRGESPRTPPDVCESGAKDSPLPSQTFHRPNIWGGAGGARVASRPDSAGSLRSPENKILNLYQKKL